MKFILARRGEVSSKSESLLIYVLPREPLLMKLTKWYVITKCWHFLIWRHSNTSKRIFPNTAEPGFSFLLKMSTCFVTNPTGFTAKPFIWLQKLEIPGFQ